MRKRNLQIGSGLSAGLARISALFIAGCVAGTLAAELVTPGAQLREHLLSPASSGFFGNLLSESKYALIALALGCSTIGVAGIPALAAARGFFLCFSMAGIVRVFGGAGIPYALVSVMPRALLTIPFLFLLSERAFRASARLIRASGGARSETGALRGSVPIVLANAAALLISAAIQTLFHPGIAEYFSGKII
ncbi:MAG: stage II sporulation protein M [Oscillospiraceae bacterium]|jgi:hypothetical protein|nr:stage II sporulation protein M [Oscillospiraceae bacterium]